MHDADVCPGCGLSLALVVSMEGMIRCPACGRVTDLSLPAELRGPRRTSGLAIASLVMGIISVTCLFQGGQILALVAIFTGILALNDIRHGAGQVEGRGMAWWGIGTSAACLVVTAGIAAVLWIGYKVVESDVEHSLAIVGLIGMTKVQEDFRENDADGNGAKDYWTGDVAGLYRISRTSGTGLEDADAGLPSRTPFYGTWICAMTSGPDGAPYAQDVDGDGQAVTHPDRWAVCMYPAAYGKKYTETFILNEEGRIWAKDTRGAPVTTWPKDPAAEGWVLKFGQPPK